MCGRCNEYSENFKKIQYPYFCTKIEMGYSVVITIEDSNLSQAVSILEKYLFFFFFIFFIFLQIAFFYLFVLFSVKSLKSLTK